jgi:hypothetical protein
MSDLEIVLLIALGVMIALWEMERRRAKNTFVVAAMFHRSLIGVARKEMTLMFDKDDKLVITEVASEKTVTIQ